MKKIFKVPVLLCLIGAVAGFIFIQRSGTDYAFMLETDGVEAAVEVVFDDMAVPHIYADSETDALYALGYVHASERLWQMDLLRRAGAGELSALLGKDMVENDQYLRTLGMRDAADRATKAFQAEAPLQIQAAAAAYLEGVNRFISEGHTPLEYRLVGSTPAPFDTRDMYCATGFMAYSFAIHLKTEPILDWMKANLAPAYVTDLATTPDGFTRIPVHGRPANSIAPAAAMRDISGLSIKVAALDAVRPVPQWIGSNAWVIGGDKTASGEVIFCNDAHMAYASPSVWYEAHIVTPDVEYYGNHIAGLPFPAIGHTRSHAWGITMFVNDDIDLYAETIKGEKYLHDGAWLDLEVTTETIKVQGGDSVEFELRKTHHGPIIHDDVAMWWAYTQYPDNKIQEAFYGFSRAESLEDVQRSAALVHAPGLNIMYGDEQGNIAWWASAKLPVRPAHVDTKASIDGSLAENDPTGWYPFEKNPQSVNPACGFVFSANNAPDSVDGVHYPGHYYAGNTRAAAIQSALQSQDKGWTVADAQRLQLSNHSPVYDRNNAMLVGHVGEQEFSPEVAELLDQMRGWHGTHEGAETSPTLYYRWMYRTIEGAMADEFIRGAAADRSGAEKFETFHKTIVSENTFPRLLANSDSPWWDDVRTEAVETPADIIAAAFRTAVKDLEGALGADASAWRYDRLHHVTHKHAMADVPVLGDFLNVGPFPVPAAKDALNKYEFKLKEAVDYEVFSGPSMRISIDFADVDAAESILPTGQSGNAFSKFYDNQAPLYHAGRFRAQRMDRADIDAHTIGVSTLLPAELP